MTVATRLKWCANWANGSTLLGMAIARIGRARVAKGPRGLYLAGGYRFDFPVAGAFTVGNVVVSKGDWTVLQRESPTLLTHEEQHSWQYVVCGGLPFLPLYAAALGWSWLRTGDFASRNVFERNAGLAMGGYHEHSVRSFGAALRSLRPGGAA
ncbi:hypothetical protein [Flexivirga oryzae]|uniref:DUF4157 domain-containing protein n=1 Tax=Flexivirga oryzae TaxID=1794944 RepID=A0A839N514_9MICO|nr:hypothetical protein [Flexivirga oryzae]MBB2891113.1 hypothetical protein [Flexivirga oryzae]